MTRWPREAMRALGTRHAELEVRQGPGGRDADPRQRAPLRVLAHRAVGVPVAEDNRLGGRVARMTGPRFGGERAPRTPAQGALRGYAPATMATRKKSSAKKPARPAASGAAKSAETAASKTAASKTAATKTAATKTAGDTAKKKPARKAAASKGKFKAQDVTLPHLFSLRPRVEKSFPPDQFRAARQQLEEERYETLEEAARAVAAKALELTRDPASKKKKGRRR